MVLTWTANTEPDLATYRVLRNGVEIATVTGWINPVARWSNRVT